MVEIFIDGDACPVKMEIIKVAERHKIKINIASNGWIRLGEVGVEVNQVIVNTTPDAADDWIVDNINQFDIVATADIPLAGRCLEKKAYALRFNGSEFTPDNIGNSLAMREIHNYMREIGEQTSHNPSFTAKNRSDFLRSEERRVGKECRL